MAAFVMKCSACGDELTVYDYRRNPPKEQWPQAWHERCPKRGPRQGPPKYEHTAK
jgi:hypothetical protein